MPRRLAWFLLWLAAAPAMAEEYRFDVSAFEKKPFEINGYTELRLDSFRHRQDGAFYRLGFFNQPARSRLDRATGAVELSGIYRAGIVSFQGTVHAEASHYSQASTRTGRVFEGYMAIEPADGLRLEAGKRALRWGKGYAWNPVGFVERPKDPNDPELSREGFMALAGSFTHSSEGPLKTVSLTAVAVPTRSGVNEVFGSGNHLNPGAKLSLLYRDTDIDLLWLGSGARSARHGVAFSRNLATNIEVHGEWARIHNDIRPVLAPGGAISPHAGSATSYLLGMRYLSERDTTWIVEYYRNGTGYPEQEMRDYLDFVHAAYDDFMASGSASSLGRARSIMASYGRPNPARHYLYLRASQKEPFDILYFTPALTTILNLDDRSYSVAPEVTYTGITNLDMRLRLLFLHGGRLSDFGEKQNDRRIELRLRLSF